MTQRAAAWPWLSRWLEGWHCLRAPARPEGPCHAGQKQLRVPFLESKHCAVATGFQNAQPFTRAAGSAAIRERRSFAVIEAALLEAGNETTTLRLTHDTTIFWCAAMQQERQPTNKAGGDIKLPVPATVSS